MRPGGEVTPLDLHQITALEAGPIGLVDIAAQVGARSICIFIHEPEEALPGRAGPRVRFPTLEKHSKPEMLSRMRDTGITVSNLEFFPLGARVDVRRFAAALELGREIGGQCVVTHIHDPDFSRAVATLISFCELARQFELRVGLEFMGLSPPCASIGRAKGFLLAAGQANLGIAVDALHFVRTGSRPAELAELAASQIAYAQLCDGKHLQPRRDYLDEALDRELPGEGCFPLREIIEALPGSVRMDVEVPSETRKRQGVSALERASSAMMASRRVIENARRRVPDEH